MKKRVLSLFLAFTLCLTLLPTSAFAEGEGSSISDGVIGSSEVSGKGGGTLVPPDGSTGEGGGIYVPPGGPTEGGGGTYIPGEDTRTEIWRDTQLSHRISRPYDGTMDGSTVSISLTFTDGTNEIELSEGKDFSAEKTFDSAEAGDHTVSVEITLIGDAAAKYKLKEGEETFTIDGTIDPAAQKLTLSLSKSTCTVGKKLLPLLSISGVEEDAAVTYYYTQYKTIAGDSEYEGSEAIPKIDENTVIDKLDEEGNNTYYVYAKTAATKNYKAGISNVVELTVSESAAQAASVTKEDGTDGGTYESLPAALNAAEDGDAVKLLENHTTVEGDISTVAIVKNRITLDMNGKTVDSLMVGQTVDLSTGELLATPSSGDLTVMGSRKGTGTNGGIVELYFESGALSIQDGAIIGTTSSDSSTGLFCKENSGTVTITGGTVYNAAVGKGASVTVSGGSEHAGNWYNSGTLNITGGTFGGVRFYNNSGTIAISGGTFSTLQNLNDSSSQIPPMSLLAPGYAFYDMYNEGAVKDGSKGDFLQNVTVKEHTHTMVDNKCACGYTCPHTSVDANGVCVVCGKQFAASVTVGEDVTYYDTFGNALVYAFKNDGCTLKLLTDVTGTTVMINNPFIFDLNGHNVDALSVDAKATIRDSGTTKGKIGRLTVSDTKVPNLTLGDLLEEGYAFQYENGYWANDSHVQTSDGLSVTVEEAPIKRVVFDAIGADNKEVPTTMAYGTTGAVTLEASCWINDMNMPTYTWYKLEGAAATAPMEGVNGVKYTLPADLPAGKHTYLVTCTSSGYSKSAEITITVTSISLAGAEVTVQNTTYNGKPQEPKVTVKLGEKTLSRDNDYTVQVTKETDAGSYKLTIKGGGNYSGEIKDVAWKIEPMKIDSVMVSADISKVYDGTAEINMAAEEWAKVLTFKTLSAYNFVDVPSSAYTISDAYFVEKRGEETIHSPNAGEKYGIAFKITLKSSNYVLQNYYDEEPATSKEYTQSGGATFTIEQAKAPDMSKLRLEQYVFNDLAKTYEIELKTLLPELAKPCEYGEVTSGNYGVSWTNSDYYDTNDPATVINGVLRLPTKAANSAKGEIGTATVTIKTTNYQDFELTLYIIAQDKIIPDSTGVTVSASDITYGQALKDSKITVSGTMICPRTKKEVKGTFAWTTPETEPDAAGDYTAEWTFTPAEGYEEYAPATGTIHIHVAPKSIEGATVNLKQTSYEYTGSHITPDIDSLVLDGVTLECSGPDKDKDYYYDFSSGTDVGTYTFTVEGFNNYTGKVTVQWSITAREVTPTVEIADGNYVYTGETIEPTVTITDDLGNTIDPKEYEVSYSSNTSAGTATVTVTDKDGGNYVLSETSKTFEITKVSAPAATPGELNITNGLHKTYSLELSTLLPKLDSPCDYGTITYDKKIVTNLGIGSFVTLVNGKTGALTLEVVNRSSTDEGQFGTITVTVSTGNYQDIPLTINVIAENKITPQTDGTVTATDITYGQTLNDSVITGKMKDGANSVDGTFAWVDGTVKPDANIGYHAEWKFTPNDKKKYAEVTGTVTIKVNQATPTGEPKYEKITTSDKTLENAALTLDGSTLKPNAGKLEWVDDAGNVLPDDTGVEANKTYKWRFTPTDANYSTLTGEIELYHVSHYTIKAAAGAGGSISPTGNVSVREGADQTFTITPDKGYTVSNVKIDGNSIGAVKSYTFENVSKAHTIEVIFVKDNTPQTGVFVDVAAGSYYEDAVDWATENGITKGTSHTTFSPDAACTRAQAVTFLWRAADSPEPETRTMPFTDVSADSYYYDAVLWAVENGITKGTSHTTFSPDATCTRAQAVTFLWRSEKSPAGDTVNPFTDVKSTDYYADAVLWAVREKITKGTGNTTFSPSANCARAQIVTLLWRCRK